VRDPLAFADALLAGWVAWVHLRTSPGWASRLSRVIGILGGWESPGERRSVVGIQSDAIRALAARHQSAYFEMRVSVGSDPGDGTDCPPRGSVWVGIYGKADFAGTRVLLWSGSCSRGRLVEELPDLLGALAHITSAGAAHSPRTVLSELLEDPPTV